MQEHSVFAPENALLVFADVVDSSHYSAILGYRKYALELLAYQNLFEWLARQYFGEPVRLPDRYTQMMARGDEGVVFCVDREREPAEQIYRAVEFVFELKTRLKIRGGSEEDGDKPPRPIGLGAGIHFGPVACVTKVEGGRSIIERLEGFSINLAKRVESCSRIGRDSRIFLSAQAQRMLEGYPLVLAKMETPMKGIQDKAEVYEVVSGYLEDVPVDVSGPGGEYFLERISEYADNPEEIDEGWLKSVIVSVLTSLEKTPDHELKTMYRQRIRSVCWHSPVEPDPILLYIRSKNCREEGRRTQEMGYLKLLLAEHPDFVAARIQLIDACRALLESDAERAEKVYARDTAREFLEHWPTYLSDEEKAKFKKLADG